MTAFFLLTALLVAGQAGAVLHAFEHDAGIPQGKVCATCVTASQLGVASIDNAVTVDLKPPSVPHDSVAAPTCRSRHVLVARQRGPPTPL